MEKKKKEPLTSTQALERLSSVCSRRELCRHDVVDRLYRWGVPVEEHAGVVDWLVSHQFIDDRRYARAFIEEKTKISRWGRRKVENALRQKRIMPEDIAQFFDEMDENDTLSALRILLKEKRRTVTAKNEYELNGKLIAFALRRGFSWDDIRKCIADADDIGSEPYATD